MFTVVLLSLALDMHVSVNVSGVATLTAEDSSNVTLPVVGRLPGHVSLAPPPLAVQLVAAVDDQLMVRLLPDLTVVDEGVSVAVTSGQVESSTSWFESADTPLEVQCTEN